MRDCRVGVVQHYIQFAYVHQALAAHAAANGIGIALAGGNGGGARVVAATAAGTPRRPAARAGPASPAKAPAPLGAASAAASAAVPGNTVPPAPPLPPHGLMALASEPGTTLLQPLPKAPPPPPPGPPPPTQALGYVPCGGAQGARPPAPPAGRLQCAQRCISKDSTHGHTPPRGQSIPYLCFEPQPSTLSTSVLPVPVHAARCPLQGQADGCQLRRRHQRRPGQWRRDGRREAGRPHVRVEARQRAADIRREQRCDVLSLVSRPLPPPGESPLVSRLVIVSCMFRT